MSKISRLEPCQLHYDGFCECFLPDDYHKGMPVYYTQRCCQADEPMPLMDDVVDDTPTWDEDDQHHQARNEWAETQGNY